MQNPRIDRTETEEERRQRQIEINQPAIALLQSWLDEDDMTPEEIDLAQEFMRGIDEFRPERKLFSHYIRE